ncbi:hypothetical protein GQ55_1G255700 [Panicum hallii var. hallii]|uniref:Uncharacterized protein n=1 Tax=Panicum hallii var. hallii TaxID=1504633 RepID=A0A2T7F7D0_9POAL|nr:hypothetical protein GQ55_1G255700 [Panicum hallii var. hallii]
MSDILESHKHLSRISRTRSTLMIYVKSYPEAAVCGLSALAIWVLSNMVSPSLPLIFC